MSWISLVAHRPAADQHLAVVAVGRGDRLGANAVVAERLAAERRTGCSPPRLRRESTSCSATMSASQRAISSTTRASRSADWHRPRRGCSRSSALTVGRLASVKALAPQTLSTAACTADDSADPRRDRSASKSATSRRPRIAEDKDDLVAERRQHDEARRMPSSGADQVVEQPDRARAGDQIDERERRNRHQPDGGDRKHAAPRDLLAHAVEPWTDQVAQRFACRAARRRRRSRPRSPARRPRA